VTLRAKGISLKIRFTAGLDSVVPLLRLGIFLAVAMVAATAAQAQKVKLVLSVSPTMLSAPHFVAKDKGYYDAAGLDVGIDTTLSNMSDTLPLLATGDYALLATSAGASAFNAMQRGGLIRLLATQSEIPATGHSPVQIMVSAKEVAAGLASLAGLKGKKIGIIGRAGYSEYDIFASLRAVGVAMSDVELVLLGRNDMGPALANGSVAAGWGTEPLPTLFEKQGFSKSFQSDALKGRGFTYFFANGDFAKKNQEACVKFLAAFLKGAREVDASGWSDPEILGIVAKYTKIAPEVLKSVPIRVTPDSLAPDLKLAAEMEDYYRGQNVLTYQGKIDFAAFYSQDIVDKALALAGR
jgi:NitT/TauT family transport system substrate-binding protein